MNREIKVTFSVSGHVKQTISLRGTHTNEEIETRLNNGSLVTTIQENGSLDITESGVSIGTITDVEPECEYDDFEVVDSPPLIGLTNQDQIMKDLIDSFDDEEGVSEETYYSVRGLIKHLYGEKSSSVFRSHVGATDGRFYIHQDCGEECWEDMMKVRQ